MHCDNPTPERRIWRSPMATLFALATAATLMPGCSGGNGRAAPVDAARAREALKTALECWMRGEAIDSLKSGSPSIVAQDFDWMAGQKLVSYEIAGDGKNDDANLRIPVKLTLRTPQGKESKKAVTYLVGTSPSITVFRDFQ
jgi:hypothetical protein